MYLLIDDVRDFFCDAIARNSRAARELLKLKCWTELGMDNDLGPNSDEEGWQILRWALKEGLVPNRVELVTSNVVAFKRMTEELRENGYKGNPTGAVWIKESHDKSDNQGTQEAPGTTQPS